MNNVNSTALILRNHYLLFIKYLKKRNPKGFIYKCAFSILNTYTALQEVPEEYQGDSSSLTDFIKLIRALCKFLFRNPQLTHHDSIVVLAIYDRIDTPVALQLGAPITHIRNGEKKIGTFLKNVFKFPALIFVMIDLLLQKELSKKYLLKSFIPMIDFAAIYQCIDFKNIKQIVTHRDRYPDEIALLMTARENGIQTIKIDNLSPLDTYAHTTLCCEYYFCPNSINSNVFSAYFHNSNVTTIQGALPSWDLLDQYSYEPDQNPKTILFFTQYWSEVFTGVDNTFYIQEIIDSMPEDHHLWIKVHPFENPRRYEYLKSNRVKIIPHGTEDVFHLIKRASFCFSVYSALSYEAKHICSTSFLINYYPEKLIQEDYKELSNFIDHIANRRTLEAVLMGKIQPISKQEFINRFNPFYPKSSHALKNCLKQIEKLPRDTSKNPFPVPVGPKTP